MKPIHWRDSARRDLDDAAVWYARQGGETLELRFIAAVESTTLVIRQYPAVGSTRHADYVSDLSAPLRYFPIRQFESYLIYYHHHCLPDSSCLRTSSFIAILYSKPFLSSIFFMYLARSPLLNFRIAFTFLSKDFRCLFLLASGVASLFIFF